MSTSIRSIVSALMITTIALSTFIVSTPPAPAETVPAHAETVSQCRARAYRQFDRLIEDGYTQAEAQKVLSRSLARCEQG